MQQLFSEYFVGYSELESKTQRYIETTLKFYERVGILEMLVQSGKRGRASKENKGRSISGWMEGNFAVHVLDELNMESEFYGKFGPFMAVPSLEKPLIEVRGNLVVPHEMSHHLQEFLSESFIEKITALFHATGTACEHKKSEGGSEIIEPTQLDERHFVTGYSAAGLWDFWAECFACFAHKESRAALKDTMPEFFDLAIGLLLFPAEHMTDEGAKRLSEIRTLRSINAESIRELL